MLECVAPADLDELWPQLEPLLRMGCEAVATTLTPEFMLAEARVGRRLIWAIYDEDNPLPLLAAWCTGTCIAADGEHIAFIECCGGHHRERWLTEALAEFERLAAERGITRIQIEGRQGWSRVLRDYRLVRVTLEKKLCRVSEATIPPKLKPPFRGNSRSPA